MLRLKESKGLDMKLTSARPTKERAAMPAAVKKKKRTPRPLIAILTVVVILLAALVSGMIYVKTRETVYPNVYIENTAVGGMTEQEAAQTLRGNGYETDADNIRALVSLPNNDLITITADDAGIRPNAEAAAGQAFAYGRENGLFASCYMYFKGIFGSKTVLEALDVNEPDITAVRAIVQPYVAELNADLAGDTYKMTETAIEVYKGAGGVLADVDGLTQLAIDTLARSLADKEPATAVYTMPEDTTDGGIDWVKLHDAIHTEPVAAKYDAGTQSVTEGKNGVSFDVAIAESLYNKAATGELVTIPLIITAPEVTNDELENMLYRDILAENTTTIDGSSNRLNNITLAAAAVNETVLNPGDTFSYNDTVGKRTTEKGYLAAGAYANGRTVQEIGGGICQVSSALYDCTLHADLEVVERRNHQFTVAYLPLGNDATVNWGTTDYKFKNNTDYPIRIETSVDGRKLNIKLIGTKLTEETIKIEFTVVNKRDYSTQEVEDESVPAGTTKVDSNGSPGYTVETYKCRYDKDGNLISRDYIARSAYNPHTKIVLVPVGTLNPISPDSSEVPDATDDPSPTETSNPYEPPATDEPIETPAGVIETPEPTDNYQEPSPEPTGNFSEPSPEPTTTAPTPDSLPPDDDNIG